MKKCKKIKELFKNSKEIGPKLEIGNFGFSKKELESSLRLTFEKVD